jgi:hypothetical protein
MCDKEQLIFGRIQGPTQKAVELLHYIGGRCPPLPPPPPHTQPHGVEWFSWAEAVGPCRWILFSTIHARATCCRSTHRFNPVKLWSSSLARLSPEVRIVPEIRHGESIWIRRLWQIQHLRRNCETFREYPREDIGCQAVWKYCDCEFVKIKKVRSAKVIWATEEPLCFRGVVSIFAAFLQSYFPHHHKDRHQREKSVWAACPPLHWWSRVKTVVTVGGALSVGVETLLPCIFTEPVTDTTNRPRTLPATGKFQFYF